MRILIEHQEDEKDAGTGTGIKAGTRGARVVVNKIYSLDGAASKKNRPAAQTQKNETCLRQRDEENGKKYPGRRNRKRCNDRQRYDDRRLADSGRDRGSHTQPRLRWFRLKVWNSQTGRWWLILLFLLLIMAALIPLWGTIKNEGAIAEEPIRVLMPSGEIRIMELEDYLVGVVAAEMPAAFEPEALKAQAVASRTFAARRMDGARESGEAYDVDTTTATQVWRSEEQMKERWGASYEESYAKIDWAVVQTRGEVLMFDQALATTVFFSNTGRLPTENSTDVWGGSVSYLISVSSPENAAPDEYVRTKDMSAEAFLQALNISGVKTLAASDIKVLERTAAGRIALISVAGHHVKGTDLRRALALASTDIEWKISGGRIFFTTYGNGHAVGLSQYGAQNMALEGRGYREILTHYYQGTELTSGVAM